MRVLIPGGAGYCGSALVPALLARDHEVSVVDPCWFGRGALPESSSQFSLTEKDARFLTAEIIGDLFRPDTVILLLGLSNDPMSEYWPWGNFELNTALPAYLALQCKLAGVKKLVNASSCSVYGHVNTPVSETTPPATQTPYGLSKAAVEVPIKLLHETGRFETLSFRKGTIGGWSPRMRFDLIVNTMVKDAVGKGVITINDPDALRPILAIEDVVAAYVRTVEEPLPTYDRVLNLASENASVSFIAECVVEACERQGILAPRIEIKGTKDIRSYSASKVNANANGFNCPSTIVDIAVSVIQNLRRSGINSDDCKYNNIKQLKELRRNGIV